LFYELNDELIVFWNLGQTSENKSQREKNGRNELPSVTFKIWFIQKEWTIGGNITEMPKKRFIDEKTAKIDKSL